MSFEEKVTWVGAAVTIGAVAWYASVLVPLIGATPVTEIAYQRPMLAAIGAMIVLSIVGAIAVSIATAVALEVADPGRRHDIDRKDERDASIDARGDRVAFYVASAVMIGVLAMAMLEIPHFWIANGTFAALALAGLVAACVKLLAYRRGF